MRCVHCGVENLGSDRFCIACGGELKRPCHSCGHENPAAARFCGQCSTPLLTDVDGVALQEPQGERLPPTLGTALGEGGPEGERKIVTALFADIKDSVELIIHLDPEEAQAIIDPALHVMGEAVRAQGGYVVQTTGDGLFALFGAPHACDDHPRRGIRAALTMQAQLHSLSEELARQNKPGFLARVGLDTGEVVMRTLDTAGRAEYTPIGHTVNLAARLQTAAPSGSIAISDRTRQLVEGYFELRSLPPVMLKGIHDPVVAHEVTGVGALSRRLQISMQRGLSRFVGRGSEMDMLQQRFEQACSGRGQIVSVVTEAGAGKSRLLLEFSRTLPTECKVVEAFAMSYGQSIPWMPVIEMLQRWFDLGEIGSHHLAREKIVSALASLDPELGDAAPYLFSLLGLEEPSDATGQMDPLVRRSRLLEAMHLLIACECLRQPLVLIFEDLHWIDAQSQLLLERLVEGCAASRLLLLLTYRTEYQPAWAGKENYTELRLQPLSADRADELLSSLLPPSAAISPLKRLIIEKAGGNPFFIEEIVHSLQDAGTVIEGDGIAPAQSLDQLKLPATVQGIIAERIDKLPASLKQLLQVLAVIGPRAPLDLIAQVVNGQPVQTREMLAELQDCDFVYFHDEDPQEIYHFKHILTQEVAYNSLLSEQRQRLHEHVGRGIEALHAERLSDHVSELAYHYVRSSNVAKAVDYLGQAGELSIQRSAHREAAENLRAAIRLVQTLPESGERVAQESRFWLALGVSLQTSLGYAASEVGEAYERARLLGERSGDRTQIVSAVRGHSIFSIVKADYPTAFQLGEVLRRQDEGRQGYAIEYLMILGLASLYTGRISAGATYFQEAIACPQETQSVETIQYSGHSQALCLSYLALDVWYLGFPQKALAYSQEGLDLAHRLSIPITLAQAQGMFALLCHTVRDYRMGERWIDRTIVYADAQGFPYWSTLGRILKGWLLCERTHDSAGMVQFADSLRTYRASGARIGLPWFLTMQAEMLARLGRFQEALLALDDGLACLEETGERYHEAELFRVKGEVLLAGQGQAAADPAHGCFQRSLAVARSQGARSLELRTACSQARLWDSMGRSREGLELLEPLYSWFTEGFDTPDLQDAQRLLERLRAASGVSAG